MEPVGEMNGLADGLAAAVDGASSPGTGGDGITQMAERLRFGGDRNSSP